ncbi:MAG: hypothetical protein ACI4WS_05955 [Oscillospiraceae bacterium]
MAKNIIYTCDVCGNQSSHRFKVKAKCLKSIRQMTEYGSFYNSLKWVKIDLCEDCYGRMLSESKYGNKSKQHEAIWRPTDFNDLYACSNCSSTEVMTYKDMTRYYCSRCGYTMTNATELKEQLKQQHREENNG